ncbi:Hypothetical protein, putative [Bodo saltans]|uniref:Uncharacterized protein n=1 Tax=Bodo saltans TaxID=75058 RepID=A0A0S4IVB1_BODSA|nr:Hypothetical protein, putative [Bodo saltans]|eukprot:CUG03243.1 Hypothetical protein, putative [Bodo saltans]
MLQSQRVREGGNTFSPTQQKQLGFDVDKPAPFGLTSRELLNRKASRTLALVPASSTPVEGLSVVTDAPQQSRTASPPHRSTSVGALLALSHRRASSKPQYDLTLMKRSGGEVSDVTAAAQIFFHAEGDRGRVGVFHPSVRRLTAPPLIQLDPSQREQLAQLVELACITVTNSHVGRKE